MRFFVTGITGFAGSHLAAHLLDSGHEVWGIDRSGKSRALDERVGQRLRTDAVSACDIRDGLKLRELLRQTRPDGVFHLAGVAFAPRAREAPVEAYDVNFLGAVELLGAVRDAAPEARVVFPSSGEVYGRIEPSEMPVTEAQPLRPMSPYGVGKAAAELAARQFALGEGLDVVLTRPFNHTGPGQSPLFVCSEFARGVAAAALGKAEPVLRVGNLDVERDFTDVRDTVRGYLALFERGSSGDVYHLASGRSVSVRSILDQLIERSGAAIQVETDPAKVRPNELRRVEVSIAKMTMATSWRPAIPLERTLDDLWSWWRGELQK